MKCEQSMGIEIKIKSRKHKKKTVIVLILLFIVVVLLIVYISFGLQNAVETYAKVECSNLVSLIINEKVLEILISEKIAYDTLTDIRENNEGRVSYISINSPTLNILTSKISVSILNGISELNVKQPGIPFGTIISSRLFSGRGAKVKVKIIPLGLVACEIKNIFQSAGINQTLHKITMNISVSISVLAPFSGSSSIVNQSVTLAETVIVGEIPKILFN